MPVETVDALSPAERRDVLDLVRASNAATGADGTSLLSEAYRFGLAESSTDGVRHLLIRDGSRVTGYAQVRGLPDAPAAELVVAPDARRQGYGSALWAALPADTALWSHQDSPAALGFAAALGLVSTRELLRMSLSDSAILARYATASDPHTGVVGLPAEFVAEPFRPGEDEQAWLDLNATAFVDHPEQGTIDRADLAVRMATEWFDPAGLILVRDRGEPDRSRLAASHWTKIDPPGGTLGEVYAVAVHPAYQGRGLAQAVTALGLAHLASRGVDEVELYVDGDNPRALRTYERVGFVVAERHRVFRRAERSSP